MFTDREHAGERLATVMQHEEPLNPDLVVAAPRGGMPIGRVVADATGVPLDIVTGKKLTAPDHSDLSIGAISADGAFWTNDGVIQDIGVSESYLRQEKHAAQRKAQAKKETYREVKAAEPVAGRHVLVVDDGLATGATMHACVRDIRENGADRITVGVPVADPRGIEPFTDSVEGVFTVLSPTDFQAVSRYYDDFHQLTDEEAMSYLLF